MDLSEREIEEYMRRCIKLARLAPGSIRGSIAGALVLSEYGKIVGEGWKKFVDGTVSLTVHAERVALDIAGERARRGCLITTLEPCVRSRSRTHQIFDPCADLILERGISDVVIGSFDYTSNAFSVGEGRQFLSENGIRTFVFPGYEDLKKKVRQEYLLARYGEVEVSA